MNIFLLAILIFASFKSFSFDGVECKEKLFLPTTKRMGSGPSTWLAITTIAPVSSSQFVTSTGACRAISRVEAEKKLFVASNYESLKIDIAMGDGAYLEAYIGLSGCLGSAKKEYSRQVQLGLTSIFGSDLDNSVENVFENIEEIVKRNPFLRNNCYYLEQA